MSMSKTHTRAAPFWGVVIRWAGALLLVASVASGQEVPSESQVPSQQVPDRIQRARASYDAGAEAFEAGRFSAALDHFSEAYELSSRAELLYNIGAAHDRLGRRESAIRNYTEYLEALPDASNRAYTQARVEILQRELDEQVARDEAVRLAEEARVQEARTQEMTPPAPAAPSGSPSVAGIVLLAGAGVAGAAAATTGVLALAQRDDLDERCTSALCTQDAQGDIDRLRRFSIATDVLIGVAVIAAATGIVLFVVGGDDDGPSVACSFSSCSARVTF